MATTDGRQVTFEMRVQAAVAVQGGDVLVTGYPLRGRAARGMQVRLGEHGERSAGVVTRVTRLGERQATALVLHGAARSAVASGSRLTSRG